TWTPPERLCIGYFTYNGAFPAAPVCQRAVHIAVEALREAGHQVVEFTVPDGLEPVLLFHGLLSVDGGEALMIPTAGDPLIKPVATMKRIAQMPHFIRVILAWILRYFYKDDNMSAVLLSTVKKTYTEVRSYACRRN